MKKRALILTAVLTAAALTGGSGYLPVTDGIRSKMIQNVYADAEDSKESADTETSDSVLDQATIMYQQYNYDEAIKLLKKKDAAYIARTLADTSVPEQQNSRTSSPTTTFVSIRWN